MPAIDKKYTIAFETSYKPLSLDSVNIRGDTVVIHRATIFNYVFLPMESVVRRFRPATEKWKYYDDFPKHTD